MKRLLPALAFLLCLCLCLPVAAQEAQPEYDLPLESYGDEYADALEEDNALCVQLQMVGNPTTGYKWIFENDNDDALSVSEDYLPDADPEDDSAPAGSGGTYVYLLTGLKKGVANLTFRYARSWEDTALCTVHYYVLVDDELNVLLYTTQVNPGL